MARRAYDDPDYRRAKVELAGLPCHHCGGVSDTVDHLIPLALGGGRGRGNLVPACTRCNLSRGGRLGGTLGGGRRRRRGYQSPRY